MKVTILRKDVLKNYYFNILGHKKTLTGGESYAYNLFLLSYSFNVVDHNFTFVVKFAFMPVCTVI